ncbi:MAG TPA: hypothetical protein VN950_24800 [Terriglobales bacterium]|nr:hypothetical protein [Terriglobales bacterium]
MSVSAISSSNGLNQANILQNANQAQGTQFQQLTQALQSGNLSSAQQLFGSLNSSATSSGLLSTQMQQDLSKLGSALQSGNLTSARQAYSSVQQNLESSNHMAAHHNRPVHGGGGSQLLTSGFPDTTGTSSGGVASDVFQALSLLA